MRSIFFFFLLTQALALNSSARAANVCENELHLSAEECSKWMATILPDGLPPSRGNRQADNLDAAKFGYKLFFSSTLSPQSVSCVACHAPGNGFTDHKPFSKGVDFVARNAPSLLNSGWMTLHFWDGRADSLWTQSLFTMEHPKEMASSRLFIAHVVQKYFSSHYEKVFGPLPDFSDLARFPPAGSPGTAPFDRMSGPDQDSVNRVYSNIGKAFEAYLRKLGAGKSSVDRFLKGEAIALTPEIKKGMVQFTRARCFSCHSGPMYSDEKFHNLGVGAWPGSDPDPGRAQGLKALLANPFNSKSKFFETSDATLLPQDSEKLAAQESHLLGAFLTPSLRNLLRSWPYGHNGRLKTLEEALDFHLIGGGSSGFLGRKDPLLKRTRMNAEQKADLISFLRALEGDAPGMPWNDWPHR
jgi:cytochrome c peroxidase